MCSVSPPRAVRREIVSNARHGCGVCSRTVWLNVTSKLEELACAQSSMSHTRVRGNEVVDGLAKKAAADAQFSGSGRRVLTTALGLHRAWGGGENLRRLSLVGQNLGVG